MNIQQENEQPQEKKQSEWLTVRQAAAHTNLSYQSIYRLVYANMIPYFRPPGMRTIRFHVSDLDNWMRGRAPWRKRSASA